MSENHHTHEHHTCGCGHCHEEHTHTCGCGHCHEEHTHTCGCGHCHEEHTHTCGCGHCHEESSHTQLWRVLTGAGLFVLGLVLGRWGWLAYIVAYLLLGWETLYTAGKNLLKGHVLDENFLMSVATLGAFAIGEFPEAVGVMLFYRVGALFEERAVARSRKQIMDAADLRPETVYRVCGDQVEQIPAEEARVGDLLLVRPGDRIPLDGVVVTGESRIDTAPITGEPVPVAVGVGDSVVSGCVNTSGQLTIRVEKVLSESMVTRILRAVETAAATKPRMDRFITRFARVYTPFVVIAAALTAVVPPLFVGNWNYWVYTALSFLVMSCPCALVLSVPLTFFSGIGAGSKKGILFKGGASIEALAKIKAVALDKTGTVTQGDFRVQEAVGGEDVLRLCAACEQNSTHPIAVSIVAFAKEQGLAMATPESVEELSGRGIRAVLEGSTVLCGNVELMEQFGVDIAGFTPEGAGSFVLVARDGVYLGYLRLADTVKPGAREAVAWLHKMGIHTAMLTGDVSRNAQAVAESVGIRQVYPRLLPQDKLQKLQALREKKNSVMFVGDGINDAPVLAGADVGAAMGSGADAAIEAADVVFMTSDVGAIPASVQIARRTCGIARQNVVFALTVKALVMVLGLLGYASMWMAVFADSGVAMLCVLNAVRMLYRKA